MHKPNEKNRLWEAVRRKLNIRRIRKPIRRDLTVVQLVEEILTYRRTDFEVSVEFEELLSVVKGLNDFGHAHAADRHPARTTTAKHEGRWLSEGEQVLARGFSTHLANLALRRSYYPVIGHGPGSTEAFFESVTKELREELFGGKLLTKKQAEQVIASPALACFSPYDLQREGIPLTKHSSVHLHSGRQHTHEHTWTFQSTFRITTRDGERECTQAYEQWSVDPPTFSEIAVPADNSDRFVRFTIWPHSVFDRIKAAAGELMKKYPWAEPQTVWFLLTDIPPHVSPLTISSQTITASSFGRTVLTIEVEPWVSAEAVKRAYIDVQRKVLGRRTENRLPPERSLAVFNFCNRMEIEADRGFNWPEKWQAWELVHPEWSYGDFRSFRTAYERAKRLATSRSVRRDTGHAEAD